MQPSFKKVFGLAVWQSYFIWHRSVIQICWNQSPEQCKTCELPAKVNYTA